MCPIKRREQQKVHLLYLHSRNLNNKAKKKTTQKMEAKANDKEHPNMGKSTYK